MSITNRVDASLIKDISNLRKIMPFMMQKRNESVVFFEQSIEVTNTLKFINNLKKSPCPITFFHIVIAALNRMMRLYPKMNRYLIAEQFYQREKFIVSFAVKPQMNEHAEIKTVKVELEHDLSLTQVANQTNEAIRQGRSPHLTTSDKEINLIAKLPNILIRFLIWAQKKLDHLNLLPKAMLKPDPLYASTFLANMGSLGLEAPFHHLYEYGGISIFAGFGPIKEIPIVNKTGQIIPAKVVTFRYSFDERIVDGFYCAKALRLFEKIVKNPQNFLV